MFDCCHADQVLTVMLVSGQSSISRSTQGKACVPASEALDGHSSCRFSYPAADMKALKAELERVLSNRQGLQQRFQQRTGLPRTAEELDEELRYVTNCQLAWFRCTRSTPLGMPS